MTLNRKTEQICLVFRTGFTLSGALFRKKCGAPSPIFLRKNWRPFLVDHRPRVSCQSPEKLTTFFAHHSRSLGGVAHYFGISAMQKIRRSFCGAPSLWGAPVRPNMLNMPKSAADSIPVLGWYTYSNTPWLRLCPERATIIATFYLFYSA